MDIYYPYIVIISLVLSVVYQLVFFDFFDCLYIRTRYSRIIVPIVITIMLLVIIVQRIFFISHLPIYCVQLVISTVGLKKIFHIDWLIAVYMAFMNRFYIYGIAGISLCTISYISELPILVLKYDRAMFGIVFIIARGFASIAFVFVKYWLMIPNRGRELTYPKIKLNQIILIQIFTSFIILSIMGAYRLELNPLVYVMSFLMVLLVNLLISIIFYEDALQLTEMNGVFDYSEDLKRVIIRQANHYKSFKKEVDRFKKLDHDYQSMLMILESLIGTSPTKKSDELINGFVNEVNKDQTLTNNYCNNIVLDALFTEMDKICRSKGIDFEAKVYLDERITISNFDIVRIANNLSRNAIEASMKINEKERFVRITSKVNKEWTIFIVENAYDGKLNIFDDIIFTTKKDKKLHGNGLKIIRELVEKKGGKVEIDYELDKVFKVKIKMEHM